MRKILPLLLIAILTPSLSQALPVPTTAPAPSAHNITRALRAYVRDFNPLSLKIGLPANAKQYRYVMVKGVLGNDLPGTMARSMATLRAQGLDVSFAPINTAASVADNSAVIDNMIRTSDKPIVFIAHSKGVADTTDAIGRMAKVDSGLVQSKVRGLVSLEGAYGGSPVADALAGSRVGRVLIKGIAKLVGGSAQAGLDLQTAARHAAIADHPMPTQLVPTVAFIGYKTNLRSLLAPGIFFLKKAFGLRSDGLVPHSDAAIAGADVARMPIDHVQAIMGKYSDRITLGLVEHVLEMPQEPAPAPTH